LLKSPGDGLCGERDIVPDIAINRVPYAILKFRERTDPLKVSDSHLKAILGPAGPLFSHIAFYVQELLLERFGDCRISDYDNDKEKSSFSVLAGLVHIAIQFLHNLMWVL
jgi:hypothetical protein